MTLKPPFRADHVGSLLRPKFLLDARDAFAAGRIDAAALREKEDEAVRHVVRLQEDAGLKGITDGEMRRASWHMDFMYQIGGVSKQADLLKVRFHNEKGDIEFAPSSLKVDGTLKLSHCIFGDAFAYLKSQVTRGLAKLTIPSPSMMHYRGGRAAIDESVYPDLDMFWEDLARVYAEEIACLAKLGCTYLQIDDTSFAYLNDPKQRAYIQSVGGAADQHLTYIRVLNRALAGRPKEMTVCTHMCRGNFRSSWVASGGYDYVADALFNQLDVDGFFMEFDDERSGGFAPLRYLPKGKRVVLGLVTTKRPDLEAKDMLVRRIEEASRHAPLDQLCLSPQCGFSSTVEGNAVTEADETAKLRLIADVARTVWADA